MLGDLSPLIATMMASRIPIPPLAFEYQILASFRKIAFANLPRCEARGEKSALVSGFEANSHFSPSLRFRHMAAMAY
jgi:hypothetical protein